METAQNIGKDVDLLRSISLELEGLSEGLKRQETSAMLTTNGHTFVWPTLAPREVRKLMDSF